MLSFFLRHVAWDKGAQDPCPDMQVPQVNNVCAAACLAEVSKHSQVPVCASSKERGMKGVCVCERACVCVREWIQWFQRPGNSSCNTVPELHCHWLTRRDPPPLEGLIKASLGCHGDNNRQWMEFGKESWATVQRILTCRPCISCHRTPPHKYLAQSWRKPRPAF